MMPRILCVWIGLVLALGAGTEALAQRTFHVDQRHPSASDRGPGTAEYPWRTISRAFLRDEIGGGDTLLVHAGLYREAIQPFRGGQSASERLVIMAAGGEDVTVSGADPVVAVRGPDGTYFLLPDQPMARAYGTREFGRTLLVQQDSLLVPVYEAAALAPGTFWVEHPDSLRSDIRVIPHGGMTRNPELLLETARRARLFDPQTREERHLDCGDPASPGYFDVRGIRFIYADNRAQWGAVCSGSAGSRFERIVVTRTNGLGMKVSGRNHLVFQSTFSSNGQAGIGGRCLDCLIEESTSSDNNWKGHDMTWEAGGGKWYGSARTRLLHHRALRNEGPGIWFDETNVDMVIEESVVEDNALAGILLEKGTVGTIVRANQVRRTRFTSWAGAGILVQAASSNLMEDNLIEDNDGAGVRLRADDRAPNDGNRVIGNTLRRNGLHAEANGAEIVVTADTPEEASSHHFEGNQIDHPTDIEPFFLVEKSSALWVRIPSEAAFNRIRMGLGKILNP